MSIRDPTMQIFANELMAMIYRNAVPASKGMIIERMSATEGEGVTYHRVGGIPGVFQACVASRAEFVLPINHGLPWLAIQEMERERGHKMYEIVGCPASLNQREASTIMATRSRNAEDCDVFVPFPNHLGTPRIDPEAMCKSLMRLNIDKSVQRVAVMIEGTSVAFLDKLYYYEGSESLMISNFDLNAVQRHKLAWTLDLCSHLSFILPGPRVGELIRRFQDNAPNGYTTAEMDIALEKLLRISWEAGYRNSREVGDYTLGGLHFGPTRPPMVEMMVVTNVCSDDGVDDFVLPLRMSYQRRRGVWMGEHEVKPQWKLLG